MATVCNGKTIKEGIKEDYLKFLSREIATRWQEMRTANGDLGEEIAVSESFHGNHPAGISYGLDLKSRHGDKLVKEIALLKDVRDRILSGEIEPGVCEDCGAQIPGGRIEASPWATRDATCETVREKEQKKMAHSSRYYRKRPIAYLTAY